MRILQIRQFAIVLSIVVCAASTAQSQDVIEFLSGAKIMGKVTNIDKQRKKVTFESKIGARTSTRVYPYSRIHAVTYRGKRYVLNQKTGGSTGTGSSGTTSSGTPVRRSKAEIERVIKEVGGSAPDWCSTRLSRILMRFIGAHKGQSLRATIPRRSLRAAQYQKIQ